MKRTVPVLLLLFSSYANAEWINEQGASLPDSEDRKAVGDFSAQLVFVPDEQALFRQWAAASETVDLTIVESVAVNQPISAFVIFSGCQPTATGQCNVSMRFRVIQPDGKTYYESPAMEVWQDKPAPPARALQLSARYLKFVVEPDDQQGRYTIQAQVQDDNTGAVLALEKAFSATDGQSSEPHHPKAQWTADDRSARRP
jgi:hypothetical protein